MRSGMTSFADRSASSPVRSTASTSATKSWACSGVNMRVVSPDSYGRINDISLQCEDCFSLWIHEAVHASIVIRQVQDDQLDADYSRAPQPRGHGATAGNLSPPGIRVPAAEAIFAARCLRSCAGVLCARAGEECHCEGRQGARQQVPVI